jgi:calcineurin-like phosphoesterase family protein
MTPRRFFTSDQHFGHVNILRYEAEKRRDARGLEFSSVDDMDGYLVDQWNSVVAQGDVVFCLGDFCYSYQQMCEVLPLLNGDKILCAGNHDPFFKDMADGDPNRKVAAIELAVRAGFASVHLHHDLELPGIGLVRLAHFPYEPPAALQDILPAVDLRYLANRPPHGPEKLLLHGHVHSQWLDHRYPGLPPMLNVAVEMWGMRPIAEDRIVEHWANAIS